MSEPLPKAARSRWPWLAVIVVLLCLGAGWLLSSEPPQVLLTLSNGERVAYRAAALGSLEHNDRSPAYRWCYRMLTRYGPAVLAGKVPAPRVTTVQNVRSASGSKSLILFFERQSSPDPPNAKPQFDEFIKLEFEDSKGRRIPGEISWRAQYGDGREVLGFESFPRLERTLIIHLTDPTDQTKTTSFEIDNPDFRSQ